MPLIDDALLKNSREEMEKYYWSKLGKGSDVTAESKLKPFSEMTDYVYKAWNAGLDKKSETHYAGALLFDFILQCTGRRFTSDVVEANAITEIGRKMADQMWNQLDASKGDLSAYNNMISETADSLLGTKKAKK
ncbi:MAG TPA: hypothetical protein QGF52_04590 [Nitrososphaerales archaeon]|nr:hypothetical protein [Nitrososphaerales archaeon]